MLIGIAPSMFVLLNGRIADLLRPARGDISWRAAFLAGLLGSPWVYLLFSAPAGTADRRASPLGGPGP